MPETRKRSRPVLIASALCMLACAGDLSAKTEVLGTCTYTMSYRDCLAKIESVSRQLRVRPDYIVQTGILTMARFRTNDGSGESILVTCSKPDRMMVLNRTSE